MDIIWDPLEIERKSMEIIEPYLVSHNLNPGQKAVIKRIIHTSGDPDLIHDVRFHPRAVEAGISALRKGAAVFTDVNMLKAGINTKMVQGYGGEVRCFIADPEVAVAAKAMGITRAAAGFRMHSAELDHSVVVIGNAPTALFEVMDLINKNMIAPALLVGTPVGFVGAAESKELLLQLDGVPFITLLGTRGGSSIAASIINALLYYQGDK